MSPASNRNSGIDLFRLLAALMVFVNHSMFSNVFPFLALLGRWTVPFFFMVSGYFFQKAFRQQGLGAFNKTLKVVAILFLLANSFYLLFVGLTDGSLRSLNTHFTLFVGTYFHLWFLTSLLLGYGILWLFLVLKLEALFPFLAGVVLILILGLNPYSYLIGLSPHPIYARSLLSIPFLMLGFLIAKHAPELYVSTRMACLLVVLGIGVQIGEARTLSGSWQDTLHYNFLGGTLLFSVGMFLLALHLSISSSNPVSYYGRRYSLAFYLYHPAVNYLLVNAWIQTGTTNYWLSPFLSILILIPLLRVLDHLSPGSYQVLLGNFQRYTAAKKL